LLKEDFLLTYGDGVSDVNISELIISHQLSGNLATLTAVQPPARFGALNLSGNQVKSFQEKPDGDGAWVNGGFFVLNRNIIDYIDGDFSPFEAAPLKKLTTEGQLMAFEHHGFWSPVDTLREKNELEDLWVKEKAPWLII
jgi:glucose-1-phosphate cytidylyltransferase